MEKDMRTIYFEKTADGCYTVIDMIDPRAQGARWARRVEFSDGEPCPGQLGTAEQGAWDREVGPGGEDGELIEAIEEAIEAWMIADWTHECGEDADGDPVYCEGGHATTCDTCQRAERDASRAGDLGREAIAEIKAGRRDSAYRLVASAAALEREYGDDPAWRLARDLAWRLAQLPTR